MPFDQVNFVLPRVETDEVLRRLIEGRALLSNPSRWARGEYCAGDKYCMAGALGYRDDDVSVAAIMAAEYLAQFVTNYAGHIPTFNDSPSTTHGEVLDVFDRAIAARRGELS